MRSQKVQQAYATWQEGLRQVANILNNEPTFELTLNSGTASTAVSNSLVGYGSFIGFMATTANAAADMNSMYVKLRSKEKFILAHADNANGDRTFVYHVIG
jgi:hypothetical protein